jgi:hypothetical protein
MTPRDYRDYENDLDSDKAESSFDPTAYKVEYPGARTRRPSSVLYFAP